MVLGEEVNEDKNNVKDTNWEQNTVSLFLCPVDLVETSEEGPGPL